MEGTNTSSSGGVTIVGSDAPSNYQVVPRTTNSANLAQVTGSHPPTVRVTVPLAAGSTSSATGDIGGGALKKKRGRPRKYGPDGSVVVSSKRTSSAAPSIIDFSAGGNHEKIRPLGVRPLQARIEMDIFGDWVSRSVGANFTPHIITVNPGEDVTMKVISFSQQGPRAICILSANGTVSSVTLRQPDSSGGTLTYEGRFEILSLTGSFMPCENGGMRNRSGGMSVSLASPDGRIVGGGVAGLLVAASPVQIVVGSFLARNKVDQNPKRPKPDPIRAVPIASPAVDDSTPPRPTES